VTTYDPFSEDPFTSDPELEAMAREFKKTLREEQEELEQISAESLETEIDISFSFLELMWNGSQTRVSVGERFFEGEVVHVGKNIVQMNTGPGTLVDINLPFVGNVFVVAQNVSKGRSILKKDPRTFIARMRELAALPMTEIELGGDSAADSISGRLKLVRSDHVVLAAKDKREWLIPLEKVGYCITRSGFNR